MEKYLVIIEKAGENYSAFSPDVPGCITTGKTVDQTFNNMHEALALYLEEADEIPKSKDLSFYLQSGVINAANLSDEYFISKIKIQAPALI